MDVFRRSCFCIPLVSSFAALIAGVGFTVAAGLMGAALGGPLPSLVPRMVTVQFIRVTVSAVIPVISSIVFAKVYKDNLHDGKCRESRLLVKKISRNLYM